MVISAMLFRRMCAARDLLADTQRAATVRQAARMAGLSPFHFIRQFQALFGETPRQFQIGRRMDRARILLATREFTVTETCFELGMSSLGSFSAAFLSRVGETPSAYQRAARRLVAGFGTKGQLPAPLFPGCFSLMAMLPASAWGDDADAAILKKRGPAGSS